MQTGAYENLTIKYYSAIILKQYISIKRYVDISPAYFFSSESVCLIYIDRPKSIKKGA